LFTARLLLLLLLLGREWQEWLVNWNRNRHSNMTWIATSI